MGNAKSVDVGRLILVPAVITLAVTLLRLIGELNGWSPRFFSREAGGAGAIVGIVWLVPIVGVYFAVQLWRAQQHPQGAGRVFGYAALALALAFGLGFGASKLGLDQNAQFLVFVGASVVGLLIAMRGWPALGKTLVAYGFSARIPVALVMLVAILNDWGTHYDVAPPNFPAMAPLAKWFWIGLVPQLTLWIGFTVIVGMLFGAAAAAVMARKHA